MSQVTSGISAANAHKPHERSARALGRGFGPLLSVVVVDDDDDAEDEEEDDIEEAGERTGSVSDV